MRVSTRCNSTRKPSAEPGGRGADLLTVRRRDLLLVGFAAALLFLPWLGARDLWNPNEPLYGQAVTEMAAAGDWLVPRVNGAAFGEKPILYFWLALATAWLAGAVDELTLRLPSALAGIASVCLLYVLVRPYAGRHRARLAALLLATTFMVFWTARQVQMDLLLTACTLGSVLGATRALDRLWSPIAGWVTAGIAAGAGCLSKGPVGLVCPALVVVGYAVVAGRARELLRPAVVFGAGALVVVTVPWFAWLWLRGEHDLLAELLVRQNLTRFVEAWDHQAPWWYYLKYFWIDMAPWSWFVPLAWKLAPDDDRERRLLTLAWVWIVVIVAFFSLSASKRSPYILPVAPAVALLASSVLERLMTARLAGARARVARSLHALLGGLLVAAGFVLAVLGPRVDDPGGTVYRAAQVTAVAFALAGLVVLVGAATARGNRARATWLLVAALGLVYTVAAARALPAADAFKSHRPFCEAIRTHVAPGVPLYGFHEWSWRASYSFYTGRPIPNLESDAALIETWRRPERLFLIVERGRLERAQRLLGRLEPLEARAIGGNFVYLFSNHLDPEHSATQDE